MFCNFFFRFYDCYIMFACCVVLMKMIMKFKWKQSSVFFNFFFFFVTNLTKAFHELKRDGDFDDLRMQ